MHNAGNTNKIVCRLTHDFCDTSAKWRVAICPVLLLLYLFIYFYPELGYDKRGGHFWKTGSRMNEFMTGDGRKKPDATLDVVVEHKKSSKEVHNFTTRCRHISHTVALTGFSRFTQKTAEWIWTYSGDWYLWDQLQNPCVCFLAALSKHSPFTVEQTKQSWILDLWARHPSVKK